MPKAVMSNSIEILDRGLNVTSNTMHTSVYCEADGMNTHKLGYDTYIWHRLYSYEL